MKKPLQWIVEAEVASCVIAAALVALILMAGHTLWECIGKTLAQNPGPVGTDDIAAGYASVILVPGSAKTHLQTSEGNPFLKRQFMSSGTAKPMHQYFTYHTQPSQRLTKDAT